MLAERYTFLLRGASMTGVGEELVWQPDALHIIRAVRSMRDEGLPAFFSMTGNGIFIDTLPGKVEPTAERLEGMGFDILRCDVGGPARLVDEHLF